MSHEKNVRLHGGYQSRSSEQPFPDRQSLHNLFEGKPSCKPGSPWYYHQLDAKLDLPMQCKELVSLPLTDNYSN
jgi:hypothetical protein